MHIVLVLVCDFHKKTKKDGIVHWKNLVCSKEGWCKDKDPESLELKAELELSYHMVEKIENKCENKPKTKRRSLTREGCKAICVLKRTCNGNIRFLESMKATHTHLLHFQKSTC